MVNGSDSNPGAGSAASGDTAARPQHHQARAEKREQSRRRVEKVALATFARRGFDAVTVEEICAEAEISPATFYRYFGSKEGVIFRYEEDFLSAAARLGGRRWIPRSQPLTRSVRSCGVAQSSSRASATYALCGTRS